jgi:hypothetical protein
MSKQSDNSVWYACDGSGKLAVWQGKLFLPAERLAERREGQVGLMAAYDGIPALVEERERYPPVDWLRKTFPGSAWLCDELSQRFAGRTAVNAPRLEAPSPIIPQ